MAVRMRLTRVGSKKNPVYRIVAADSRSPRDGKFIEIVGRYNPQTDPSTIELDAFVLMRSARAHDGAQRAGGPALPPDHLADVLLGDAELEHGRPVALDLLDVYRIRIVDEPPSELGQQFSQCPSPSAAA